MRLKVCLLVGLAIALPAPPALAQALRLEDGEYSCSLSPTMKLGSIWIRGDSYVGPSRDPNDTPHPFEVTDSGTINWGAPLGGLDTDGNHVIGTVIHDAGGGKTGFDIQFQTETGNTHIASCGPEF